MLSSVALEQPSVYAIGFPLLIPTCGALAFCLAIGIRLRHLTQLPSRPDRRFSFSPTRTAPVQNAACTRASTKNETDTLPKSTSQERESFQVKDAIGTHVSSKEQTILNSLERKEETICMSYASPSVASGRQLEPIPPEKQPTRCSCSMPIFSQKLRIHLSLTMWKKAVMCMWHRGGALSSRSSC